MSHVNVRVTENELACPRPNSYHLPQPLEDDGFREYLSRL